MEKKEPQVLTRQDFEEMILNAFDATMKNAYRQQTAALEKMRDRMTNDEFTDYLKKEREKILSDRGLQQYDSLQESGLRSYKTMAFMAAQMIEDKKGESVNWIECWGKSTWKEEDLVKEYFRGGELEGRLFATKEFQEKPKKPSGKLTFENWKNRNWPKSAKDANQPFEDFLRDEDGHYVLYSLSKEEYQKIADYRNAIFEKQVALFLQGQINGFEQRFAKSLEKKLLIKSEQQKVKKWLTKKNLAGAYSFPNPNGGIVVFPDLHLLLHKEGKDKNSFPSLYDKLIVQGEDVRTYLEPKHEKAELLPKEIAVHVLHRYRLFLEGYLSGSTDAKDAEKTTVGRLPIAPRTFLSLFKGDPEMKLLLDAAESIGLIATDGDKYTWPDEGNKGHRVRALWYAAVDARLTKEKAKSKEAIAKAIQVFFGMESLSKDTLEKESPYNEVYKSTKAALVKSMKG